MLFGVVMLALLFVDFKMMHDMLGEGNLEKKIKIMYQYIKGEKYMPASRLPVHLTLMHTHSPLMKGRQ